VFEGVKNFVKPNRLLWFAILLAVGMTASAGGSLSEQYVIFHVDAISTPLFEQEYEAGRLPNIEAFFAAGGIVHSGLSLWPGGTEVIYPRLKPGYTGAEHPSLGWQYLDREEDRWIESTEQAGNVFFGLPRRSRFMTIHAHPPALDFLTSMSMQNIPYLLQYYDALEILWFATDHAGHVSGVEGQLASLYRFDRALGALLDHWDYEGVNVILYSDHGMSYENDYLIPIKSTVESVLGDDLFNVYYPNVYLHEPERAPEAAETLLSEIEMDWAFYRKGENELEGIHPEGAAVIRERDGRFSYEILEGPDPFGYDAVGYEGEYLDHREWLVLTEDTIYPGAIPNIYWTVDNPNAGDVIMVMNPPRIPQSMPTNIYNHKGLSKTDLLVPIAFRGPQLTHLYDKETMWLHEIYTEHVPDIPFDTTPEREKHHVQISAPVDGRPLTEGSLDMRFSPEYRVRLGSSLTGSGTRLFAQYDAVSTFLFRVWLGAGFTRRDGVWATAAHSDIEWQWGQWGAGLHIERSHEEWNVEPKLVYHSEDYNWSVEISDLSVGVRWRW